MTEGFLEVWQHWQNKCDEYEWLYLEQKEICKHYRQIVHEKEEKIKELESKKSFDKTDCTPKEECGIKNFNH